ncbi:HK97 gp10 family phage protein [Qiania dongpingensis]|uniref:HK97 gp10 family phage protein n=1 Tax=Qiania dongpingensis TaxID=2763669 RepID=A0A7G9G6Y9_9FIRM|nr:HK97 gp10 family phage protein [Qiania dongpingensis]QNM06571.1 HK97 gp10 family phage protein [Qiania dongpingensis]
MSKRTNTNSLAITIRSLMEDYAADVAEDMKKEAKEVSKGTVKTLKTTSPKGTGKVGHYKDGWASKVERENAVSIEIKVHNRKKPWLTHLLEKGHAKRGGGRVEGIPHIAPAEKRAIEDYERRLKERLSR